VAVVQDPDEAEVPSMPRSAIRYVKVDHVLPAAGIGEMIAALASVEYTNKGVTAMARKKEPEPQDPSDETDVERMEETFGPASGLTCPDCGGALWEVHNGELARYRCHVGHQYTTEGLDAAQQDAVESALWSAVRVLEEHSELRERMASRALSAGMEVVSSGFAESASDSKRQAHTIRELLFSRAVPAPEAAAPPRAIEKRAATARGGSSNGKGRKTRRRVR
jgi:two-component system chemotaxis response regulator CheB